MSDRCFKGVNWGNVTFDDEQLVLSHNKRRLCKLSLKKFTNSTVNKTDIVIDLNTIDLQDEQKKAIKMNIYASIKNIITYQKFFKSAFQANNFMLLIIVKINFAK